MLVSHHLGHGSLGSLSLLLAGINECLGGIGSGSHLSDVVRSGLGRGLASLGNLIGSSNWLGGLGQFSVDSCHHLGGSIFGGGQLGGGCGGGSLCGLRGLLFAGYQLVQCRF